jgi:hypothetical protein
MILWWGFYVFHQEDDSESKLLESIEHLTQKHGNDACFLQPVPEKAQMNEENEFEMSKSVELNVDKTSTNGTEKSIIDTGKNENDSGCKSMEHIEPPPQDHGKDACFLEPVPEKAQPFEVLVVRSIRHYHVSVLDVLCFPATSTRNHLPFSPDLFQFFVRLHKLCIFYQRLILLTSTFQIPFLK